MIPISLDQYSYDWMHDNNLTTPVKNGNEFQGDGTFCHLGHRKFVEVYPLKHGDQWMIANWNMAVEIVFFP